MQGRRAGRAPARRTGPHRSGHRPHLVRGGCGRWTVTGSGHDRRLDVTLNTTDFAAEMYEIRENGHFVSRHRYRHHADAAVRQLLADGVEIGERTPGPTPAASTEPDPAAPMRPLAPGPTPAHSL